MPRRPTSGSKASSLARRLTRWALRRGWSPVFRRCRPPEVEFVISTCSPVPVAPPVVERIDRRIDRLPGLAGL
ncbi:MAG: hypothetical protein R2715_22020 [Ilumatobacteraceae bacterium]